MPPSERALASQRALVPVGAAPTPPGDAERRLAAALDEVTRLDAEVESLSAALAEFSRRYEQLLGDPFAGLDRAERLVGRLQALEDEVTRLAALYREGTPLRRTRRRAKARRSPPREDGPPDEELPPPDATPAPAPPHEEAAALESDEVVVKRLFRRLARVLHPDLASDDAERRRLGDLMAQVNAAYARRDRTALELMAERVGAGEPLGDLSDEERRAHLEKRIAALSRIAASLARERDRLRATRTERLREEARRREAEGHDYFAETRAAVAEEAAEAIADGYARLARLSRAARDLGRMRRSAMGGLSGGRKTPGGLRPFDPLAESALVRRGVAQLERQRATAESRELARHLEERASDAPWEVALTLFAFFAEVAGRPPESIGSAERLADRYGRVAREWGAAPAFDALLTRLPRHLEIGLRAHPGDLASGVQLRSQEFIAGVRIALDRATVAAIGRSVLEALGPEERCARCEDAVLARHLMRTRGLDELNGLLCPRCAAVLRSYWRYGEPEGLEALEPLARQLGAIEEVSVRLAGTTIGFGLLPGEREKLTAQKLRRRVHELYFAAYAVPVGEEQIALLAGGEPLAPEARLPASEAIVVAVGAGAGLTAEEAIETLRLRIERRFRP